MPRFRRALSPNDWIYLLVYAVVVLFGLLIMQFWDALGFALGSSIAATGIAGWVIFLYVRSSDKDRERIAMLRTLGVEEIFVSRSSAIRHELEPRLDAARNGIDIMGFGLRALREDLIDHFEDWAKTKKVRILLLDPEFPQTQFSYADQRDREEANPPGTIRSDVQSFLSATAGIRKMYPETFSVRLYQCLPMVNIARMDDEIFWGPYFNGLQSRNTPTFRVVRTGVMYKVLVSHFDKVWSDDKLSSPAP